MRKKSLGEAATVPVSHNPAILKRVMLQAGDAPGLTNFSQAVFTAGQIAHGHSHDDMWEVFFVQRGRGRISIDGADYELEPGICVVVEPGEWHEVANRDRDDLVVLYFGLRERREEEG
jgi:mannose-6-phosphate isomerase-like protein (cupin superfamily)